MEGTVVEQPGERIGAGLVLESRADLRVVERERRGVAEALRQLELVVPERGVLAGAIDVQHALDLRPRDQRNRDQRLRVDRRAGHEAHPRIEVGLVDEHRLAVARGPAGDPLVEADRRPHDLVRIVVAREHRDEQPLRLVGLVDRQRVVRDQVGERVRDAHEQRVEAQLGEHLVEDVGQPPVRVDELERRGNRDGVLRQQPKARRRARYHATLGDVGCLRRRRPPGRRNGSRPSIANRCGRGIPRTREAAADRRPILAHLNE